jgi:NADPH:quinone reductase-like Zn-dependent oxidoreductase/SAM-dependent methyltransferase/short-subunit dehydrogenase involved in D-alanine esterification of teichoic acids
VEEAMHSYQVDYIKRDIISSLSHLTPLQRLIPVVSTYTPKLVHTPSGHIVTGQYWYESLRNPVLFTEAIVEAVRKLELQEEVVEKNGVGETEDGSSSISIQSQKNNEWIFLECDPHPVLRAFINDTLALIGKSCTVVATLMREDFKERECILRSFGHLYALGFEINFKDSLFQPFTILQTSPIYELLSKPYSASFVNRWNYVVPEKILFVQTSESSVTSNITSLMSGRKDVSEYFFVPNLPLYPWQRQKCWNENEVHIQQRLGSGHPIVRILEDTQAPTFQSDISTSHIPWVVDHRLQSNIVIPGVTFVECILTCGKKVFNNQPFWLRDVKFLNAFYMNKGEVYRVNISLAPIQKGGRFAHHQSFNVTLSSRVLPKKEYVVHCALVLELEEEMAAREAGEVKEIGGIPGSLKPVHPSQSLTTIDLEGYRKLCPYEIPVDKFFSDLWEDGLELYRELRLTRKIWINDYNNPLISLGLIELNPETTSEELSKWGFMYPPMLDSCLQSGLSAREYRGAFFPVEAFRARFLRPFPPHLRRVWALSRKDPSTQFLSMTCVDDDGVVYGSLQDVRIHYLEKDREGVVNEIGGVETPVYDHIWHFEKNIPVDSSTKTSFSLCTSIVSPGGSLQLLEKNIRPNIEAIAGEYSAVSVLKNVVPYSNKLVIAIILYVFRVKFNFWNYSSSASHTSEKQSLFSFAKENNIGELYFRLLLLLFKYLSESGHVKLTPSESFKDIDVIEHVNVIPTIKYFNKVNYENDISNDVDIIEENPFSISSYILSKWPQSRPSIVLMMEVGMRLNEVIVNGGVDPISLIFGDNVTADAVYRDDLEVRLYNYFAQAALAEIVKSINNSLSSKGDDNLLNILEVGAGTGGTTTYLLENLDLHRTSYTYTDIGRSFFIGAKEKFSKYSNILNFKSLNIEVDPIEQGFEANSQDVIIAANVLHATRDLKVSVSNVFKLLKPGGYLLLLEASSGLIWLDIVFGLTKGWWALTDTQLRRHPLLTDGQWKILLKDVGFAHSSIFNRFDSLNDDSKGRLCVYVAQKPKIMSFADSLSPYPSPSSSPNLVVTRKIPPSSILIFAEKIRSLSPNLIKTSLSNGLVVVVAVRDEETIADLLENSDNFHSFVIKNHYSSREGYDALWKFIEDSKLPPVISIVHAWSLDLPKVPESEEELKKCFNANLYSPLYLAQSLIAVSQSSSNLISPSITTWGITKGVWCVDNVLSEGEITLGQCCLWGFNRCLLNELSSIHPKSIDVSAEVSRTETSALINIVLSEAVYGKRSEANVYFSGKDNKENEQVESENGEKISPLVSPNETEIALRGTCCYVHRLIQNEKSSNIRLWYHKLNTDSSYYALATPSPNKLVIEERKKIEILDKDDVEVQVAASGIVYRDLMMWSGKLPLSARQGGTVGLEFAGVVNRIGKNVSNVKVGDRVFGVGRECCGSYIVVSKYFVGHAPSNYPFDQIGGIGLEIATAYYSLVTIGRIRKGDFVLIHTATGGVGLCALFLCRYFGGIPICTAGTPYKRKFLELMGVKHVFDSRTTKFSEDVLRVTNNRGVDILLNSLSGYANIHAGMKCMAKRGRFLEIGKVDVYGGTKIETSFFKNNASYNVVAIDQLLFENDPLIGDILDNCSKLLESGSIPLPPVRSFALSEAERAYRYLLSAEHIGKVVLSPISLSFSDSAIPFTRPVLPLCGQGCYVNDNGTYLVTGGIQGFSLELGIGLLERGCKTLILTSRKGIRDSKQQSYFELLRRKYNANVIVKSCDASSVEQTKALLNEIRTSLPPLRGVIHGAMVLQDGYIHNLSQEAFWTVLAPKSFGAWIIHQDCQKHNDPLDFFVTLSSLNVVVGTGGQANYGSANMFLDGLTLYRRSLNLPSISIQWGVLGGVGYVHRNIQTVGENMATFGFRPLSGRWANRILHTCLQSQSDVELEHIGKVPPSPQSLSSFYADSTTNLFKSMSAGLLPSRLFPENQIKNGDGFFEGSKFPLNIYRSSSRLNFPPGVPVSVGVFNVEWNSLFDFMAAIGNTGRFSLIRQNVAPISTPKSGSKEKADTSTSKPLASTPSEVSSDSSLSSIEHSLSTITSTDTVLNILAKAIAEQTAKVLGIGSDTKIATEVPLAQFFLI